MTFRVLVMMIVLLGLWIGFGAPMCGVVLSPLEPDSSIPTFAEARRSADERVEAEPIEAESEEEKEDLRLCENPNLAELCENNPSWHEAPPLD